MLSQTQLVEKCKAEFMNFSNANFFFILDAKLVPGEVWCPMVFSVHHPFDSF